MANRCIVGMLLLLIGTTVWGDDPSQYFNKSYAVVIGIRNYKATGWKELVNAENDAKAMADFLKTQGFEVKPFVGPQATKAHIIAYLEDDLAPRLTRRDRIIFYFSGHGATMPVGGRNRGYLIPYDGRDGTTQPSTWIAMEQLQELADKLGNALHQLFILDACFGGLFATKSLLSSIPERIPSYITEVTARRARQYLTAGGDKESTPASSNLDGYREYSHYTAYLLKGLRDGVADTYPDGVITASELDAYLGPAAKSNFNTPRGGHFPGHEQGNFVFRSPKPAVEEGGTAFKSTLGSKGPRPDDDAYDWGQLASLGEPGLKRYLEKHPNGRWAGEARARLDRSSPTIINPVFPSVPSRPLTEQEQNQARYV